MKYIGLDVHAKTTRVCAVEDGVELGNWEVATTAEALLQLIDGLHGPKRVVVEEGLLADWTKRLLEPRVDEAIICDPKRNRLISEAEDKDDPVDAHRLAVLLQLAAIRHVYHADCQLQQLKESVIAYWQSNTDVVRVKNRLKHQFLRRGIQVDGKKVYRQHSRDQFRQKLKQQWGQTDIVDSLWQHLDFVRQQRIWRWRQLQRQIKPYGSSIKKLKKIAGVGPKVALTFYAIIGDANRFPNKRALWKYCGLALRQPRSAGKSLRRHKASREGNRRLKNVLMIAAGAAQRSTDNRLADYSQHLQKREVSKLVLRRSLARKIAVSMWTVMKQQSREVSLDRVEK